MAREFEGRPEATGGKFAVVVSRFNRTVTDKLLEGCLSSFRQHGVDTDHQLDIFFCPGAFEIPQVAAEVTRHGGYAAVVCLGAVIRGETPHFDYIAGECARGVAAVARRRGVPVLFGVLTTDTFEQAMERAGGTVGNKGWDAALGAMTMADLFSQIGSTKGVTQS